MLCGQLLTLLCRYVRGYESQRLCRHDKDPAALHRIDGRGGRHPGLEFQVGVRGVDHDLVCHYVRRGGRLQPHLPHRTVEGVVGICVDGEIDTLALLHGADVGLVDVGYDLHLAQVVGYGEERWGRVSRRYGLSLVDGARQHHAADGRVDLRVAEVYLGTLQRQLGLTVAALGLEIGRLGIVILRVGDEVLLEEVALTLEVLLLELVVELRGAERLLGYGLLGFERRAVELRDELALLHLRVEIDIYVGYDSRDLCTHVDLVHGVDRTRGRHREGYGVGGDDLRLVVDLGALAAAAEERGRHDHDDEHRRNPDDPFLHCVMLFVLHCRWGVPPAQSVIGSPR